jgi:deoxycytidylate deaminase
MDFKKLSIKNFIGDLPNIVNSNFEVVKSFIDSIFDTETNTIHVRNAVVKSKVTANSVIANNIVVNGSNGKSVSMGELLERLENLETKYKESQENNKQSVIASYSRKK